MAKLLISSPLCAALDWGGEKWGGGGRAGEKEDGVEGESRGPCLNEIFIVQM